MPGHQMGTRPSKRNCRPDTAGYRRQCPASYGDLHRFSVRRCNRLVKPKLEPTLGGYGSTQARRRPGGVDMAFPFKCLDPVPHVREGDPGALSDLHVGDESSSVLRQFDDRLEDHLLGTE